MAQARSGLGLIAAQVAEDAQKLAETISPEQDAFDRDAMYQTSTGRSRSLRGAAEKHEIAKLAKMVADLANVVRELTDSLSRVR